MNYDFIYSLDLVLNRTKAKMLDTTPERETSMAQGYSSSSSMKLHFKDHETIVLLHLSHCICEIVIWVSLDVCGSTQGLSRSHDNVCMQLWGFGKLSFFLKATAWLDFLCCVVSGRTW